MAYLGLIPWSCCSTSFLNSIILCKNSQSLWLWPQLCLSFVLISSTTSGHTYILTFTPLTKSLFCGYKIYRKYKCIHLCDITFCTKEQISFFFWGIFLVRGSNELSPPLMKQKSVKSRALEERTHSQTLTQWTWLKPKAASR